MPEFVYCAVDRNGHHTDGITTAADEHGLEQQLRKAGYWLIDAEKKSRSNASVGKQVKRRELIDFFNGMAALLSAGIPIADALKAMVEEIEDEALAHILEDLEVNVQIGNALSETLRKYPKVFSDQVCNLVTAGEHSGNLENTFKDLASHTEWVERIRADVKQASLYPAMILLAVAGLIALMFTFVVPRFATIFEDLEIELPLLTQIVVSLGKGAEQYWWAVLLGFATLVFTVRFGPKHSATLRRGIDRFKLNVPILGRVNRLLVLSSFVHNLSLMLRAGVPILESLQLCRGVVGNVVMEDAVKDAELAVTEGRRMSEALRSHEIVSSLTLRMMVIGEETGRLDEALRHVKARFDDEIPRRIKRVFSVMEPLITLFLIGIVGLVAASVFLPMFSLISGLGN